MKKKKVLIIFILCVLVIGIPYMNVEIKTYKYGDQLIVKKYILIK